MKKTNKSASGTSFHDTIIRETPANMKKLLGAPEYEDNSGDDKVNMEWIMETSDGTVFTIYDWKEYMPLNENAVISWHIGGYSKQDTELAREELRINLFNIK